MQYRQAVDRRPAGQPEPKIELFPTARKSSQTCGNTSEPCEKSRPEPKIEGPPGRQTAAAVRQALTPAAVGLAASTLGRRFHATTSASPNRQTSRYNKRRQRVRYQNREHARGNIGGLLFRCAIHGWRRNYSPASAAACRRSARTSPPFMPRNPTRYSGMPSTIKPRWRSPPPRQSGKHPAGQASRAQGSPNAANRIGATSTPIVSRPPTGSGDIAQSHRQNAHRIDQILNVQHFVFANTGRRLPRRHHRQNLPIRAREIGELMEIFNLMSASSSPTIW